MSALHLLFVMILIARFCNLDNLSHSNPQEVIANCKWDKIKEQYISFMAERGKKRLILFITASVRYILFDIFDAWEFVYCEPPKIEFCQSLYYGIVYSELRNAIFIDSFFIVMKQHEIIFFNVQWKFINGKPVRNFRLFQIYHIWYIIYGCCG